MPLSGSNWDMPVTAAEVLPWTIVKVRPLTLDDRAAAFSPERREVRWE
jgi:hypothetical protein